MIATNYTKARKNLKKYCDIANDDAEIVIVTRKNGGNVVLISEDNYNNLIENLYVRSDQKYYKELLESIAQINKGKGKIRELLEDE